VTNEQMRYWRGGLLYSICDGLGVPKEDREKASKKIHKSIKHCFGIESFALLSSKEFEKVAGIIRMVAAREWAYLLREPDEFDCDPNTMTMKEFLKHKNLI